jgi:hypothetical protein
LITAVAGAWLGFAADAWSQANLNPPNSLCLELRNASSLNAAGPCMSEDSECKSGPMPDGILQCTDEDLDPLDGGICVDQACYLPGSQIVVDLEVGPTDEPVCGTQVFLSWDVANLRFDGAVADPDGDFTQDNPGITFVLVYQKDFQAGTIDLAVALPINIPCDEQNGTTTGGTLARLFFQGNGECKSSGVSLRPHNPPSYISGPNGPIPITGCNGDDAPSSTDELTIQGPPLWKCPAGDSGSRECGDVTLPVEFPPITLNTCDPIPPITELCTIQYFPICTSSADCPGGECVGGTCSAPVDPPGFNLENLLPSGGSFLLGRTEIHCEYTDSCGQSDVCDVVVENNGPESLENCNLPAMSTGGMAVLVALLLLGTSAVASRRSRGEMSR